MSLITRCPACGTMFRVVPDQLKISEGWVRCGHCGEVFDATENLLPEGRQAAAPMQPADADETELDEEHAQPPPAPAQDFAAAPQEQDSAGGQQPHEDESDEALARRAGA